MKKLFLILLLCLLPAAAMAESVPADIGWDEEAAHPMETPVPGGYIPLVYGDYGEEVANLQLKLSELNYYDGEITGSYGDLTRAAVKMFQSDFYLLQTGEADAETQSVLFGTKYRPLRLGSTGEDVRLLQVRLTALGYYTGKISGTYLPATQEAVYNFQLICSDQATGEADTETLHLLYSNDAITWQAGQALLPEITPVPDSYLILDSIEVTEPTPAPTVAYTKKLQYESKGDLVKTLQQRLTDLGYYEGNISGKFLGHTRNAVKALQQQNALEVDGVVGEKTWNVIFNDPDVRGPKDEPRPTPEPTPVPFAITVDVNNQVTTVYGRDENGDYTVVVRQMLCSTGTKATPSDVGDWVLSGRTARWCDFPQWGGHAQYWTKINSSIAFHSVIYNSYDTMDLSTKSYRKLGQRASHGCIRLTVADAKWIYNNCGEGTVVTITEDLPADPELRAALKLPSLNTSNMLPRTTPQPTAAPDFVYGEMPPGELRTLKKNSSGADVYWLQATLKELGYYGGYVSGTYLDGTLKAVKAFQKANGLSISDSANAQTQRAIYAAAQAAVQPTATPVPTVTLPAPTVSPTPAP